MNVEALIYDALKDLASGRVYPDVAPPGSSTPYVTYTVVGGRPVNYQSGEQPDRANARIQISCWSQSRIEASTLGSEIEAVIRESVALQPEVLTGRVSTFDEETQYRGTRQEFSVWY